MMEIAKPLVIAGLSLALVGAGPLHTKSAKHRAPRPAVIHQQQIACTVLGCQPIPAACYPKEEHSPTGIPTGFDQIICPPGIWPF
jgi:hypothetical protein